MFTPKENLVELFLRASLTRDDVVEQLRAQGGTICAKCDTVISKRTGTSVYCPMKIRNQFGQHNHGAGFCDF